MALNFREVLFDMMEKRASDLHIKVGSPPLYRIDGQLIPSKFPMMSKKIIDTIVDSLCVGEFKDVLLANNEVDLAYRVSGMARFRVNVFKQRGTFSIVMRLIPMKIPTMEELRLPEILKSISMEPRGLILVTGVTGSGKSTTLAAMIEHINSLRKCHIITIEDPIEFVHRDKLASISQREVTLDTASFSTGLRSILRQDPDVILIGECRDLETMHTALASAETGHLVFSTLHTTDATETITRIIDMYPPYQQKQVRILLASHLKAIISQRLLPRADGYGMVVAIEIMRRTSTIAEYIVKSEETHKILDMIEEGSEHYGMQSFDQSLMDLYKGGLVSLDTALVAATNPSEFKLKLKGIGAKTYDDKLFTSEDAFQKGSSSSFDRGFEF
ncbi:MAG: type IV pilus twitching motility protein PilT [Candidatus Coatesbacteria bacterium]|nr:type IV pilus twitching motility protein PilT [Candidatus Coatesbacteria bacterium]